MDSGSCNLDSFYCEPFCIWASAQKTIYDNTPAEQILHNDRWLQVKQSTVTVGMNLSMSMIADVDIDEEDNSSSNGSDLSNVGVSPGKPR